MSRWHIHEGDSAEVIPDVGMLYGPFDSMVTDPPAGISFMGKEWDQSFGGREDWVRAFALIFRDCLGVLRPGAHALVWALPRTSHWTACALEDAGFEVRDVLTHHFGTGFPKSLDAGKAIDKADGELGRLLKFTRWMRTTELSARQINDATNTLMGSHYLTDKSQPAIPTPALWAVIRPFCGIIPLWVDDLVKRIEAEREVVGKHSAPASSIYSQGKGEMSRNVDLTAPATLAAQQWDGWGTALKPASEHWILARRPLGGTVAACLLEHGAGAINVDGCRVGTTGGTRKTGPPSYKPGTSLMGSVDGSLNGGGCEPLDAGRWPANLLLTHYAECDEGTGACVPWCPVAELDGQSGEAGQQASLTGNEPRSDGMSGAVYGKGKGARAFPKRNDSGGASRFFPRFRYQAKASKAERNLGLDGPEYVWYASPQWVNEVLLARLPADMELSAKKAIVGSGTQKSADSAWSTCWCGSVSTDPCHLVIKSIIETMTSLTTDWKTSNWLMQPHTNGCMAAVFSEGTPGGSLASSATNSSPWAEQTGISPKKDGPSTVDAGFATSVEFWLKAEPVVTEQSGKTKQVGPGVLCISTHPTVKSTELMRWLCRLVTPAGGLVLDPFCGSGSTGVAALAEGFRFVGVQRTSSDEEALYARIARARLEAS